MLLIEVATVTDIASARKKANKKKELSLGDSHVNKPKQREFKDPDEVGAKRRSKLSTAGQFRDVARGLKKNK